MKQTPVLFSTPLMPSTGIDPATFRSLAQRSNQLSYAAESGGDGAGLMFPLRFGPVQIMQICPKEWPKLAQIPSINKTPLL